MTSVVPVRCTVRCTVIRNGTIIWSRTVFKWRTIYTVKYGSVQKAGNWIFCTKGSFWLIFTRYKCCDSYIPNLKLNCSVKEEKHKKNC